MKKWLWLVLFGCTSPQADMLDALKSYESEDYVLAKQHFAELIPLGNELAAFNLGVMAYQGQGQKADLASALAYFMLAAELNYPQAQELFAKLSMQASEQQLEQARQLYEQLNQAVVISDTELTVKTNDIAAVPVKRVAPKYPVDAAKHGVFGYVALRFLVDADGNVVFVDTLDAYPIKVFEKSAMQAVKRWKYQPTGRQHLLNVRLDFSMEGAVSSAAVEKVVEQHKLWHYAVVGAPEYQLALGTLLSLLEVQSPHGFWYDPEAPLSNKPDFSIYKKRSRAKADIDGFWGKATVRVNEDGVVTQQLNAVFEDGSTITNLIGLKLHGDIDSEVYRLSRRSSLNEQKIYVEPSVPTNRAMSGKFWWEQAAKNGNIAAQRIMAAYDKKWESYLLQQQDAEVMAWAGTKMMLEGDQAQGMQFLDGAIAKNYELAEIMKKQVVWYKGPKEIEKRP